MLRRGIVPAVLVVLIGGAAWGLTRLMPRSPILILLVCVLAVITMKLVEHRVRRWFRQWEERAAAAEVRGQRADARDQRSEVRGPRSDGGGRGPEGDQPGRSAGGGPCAR